MINKVLICLLCACCLYTCLPSSALADITPPDPNPILDLYIGTFARAPDSDGLQYWQDLYDRGVLSLAGIASNMMMSSEAQRRYPSGVSNEKLIWLLYDNLFDRSPDVGGFNYWVPLMYSGDVTREESIAIVIGGARADSGNPNDPAVFNTRVAKSVEYLNQVASGQATFDFARAEEIVKGVHRADVANLDLEPPDLCDSGVTEICGDGIDQNCDGINPVCTTVPNVVGQTQAAAVNALAAAGLAAGPVVYLPSNSIEAGRVISQQPSSGGTVPAGTRVRLEVAAGAAIDPGDPAQYFPNNIGDTWYYNIRESGGSMVPFRDIATLSVTGTRTVLGQTASVFEERMLSDNSVIEYYYAKRPEGVLNLGSNDPEDPLTPQLIPYWELVFPFELGEQFTPFSRSNLDFGSDLDGDGVNERIDLSLQSSITGTEPVSVPAGSFAAAGKRLSLLNGTLTLSYSGYKAPITVRDELWAVAGAGVVKQVTSTTVETETLAIAGEARGYVVNGVGHGLGAPSVIAADLSPGNGYLPIPIGNPVAASDGTNVLIMARVASGTSPEWFSHWIGMVVDPDGTVLKRFNATAVTRVYDGECGEQAALAFDGENFLFVYEQDNNFASSGEWPSLAAVRISPAGQVLGTSVDVAPPGSSSPAIAFNGSHYLLVYQYRHQESGLDQVYAALIDADTVEAGGAGAFAVTPAPGYQTEPAVACDGTNCLVAWDQAQWGNQSPGVRATRVSQAGTVLDADGFAVFTPGNLSILPTLAQSGHPRIAFDGTNYLVAYERWPQNLVIQLAGMRISKAGTLLDGTPATGGFAITSNVDGYAADVALTFTGTEYWAAWRAGGMSNDYLGGIYGARIGVDGTIRSPGASGMLMSAPADLYFPAIATNASGGYLAWLNQSYNSITNRVEGMPIYPFGQ